MSGHPPLDSKQQQVSDWILFASDFRTLGKSIPGTLIHINGMLVPISEMIRREIPMAPYLPLSLAANSEFEMEYV